ncbi:MAG: GAF domain-containing protein [Bacteroidales bacterium]|nr:GAF domain-containing protein [Bacteroidales bacterium]
MKLRFSFTLKIMLPYLAIAALFLFIFLGELVEGHSPVIWLSAAGIVASIIVGIVHIVWLKKPLYRIRNLVVQLTRGNMPVFSASKATDEIGDLERGLEKHVSNLQQIAAFSRSMATGDFTGRFDKLSGEDELGEALLSLKDSLMESLKDSESRRREEENRTWSAHGLAKFSSLFREAEDNLHDLSRVLMKELVGYSEADVGALFIAMDQEEEKGQVLELFGSYAFDREKYIHQSFEFGEGLVGRAAVEKEVIYVTDLPLDYIKIRSGLGEDVPSSILLVPVMLDNNVLGVIELASLGEMPAYQIEFIGQLGDALATTLAKVKANLQNRKLFEQTKKQAEELASQEKVFRQNMEMLEKAQDEYVLREEELLKEIETLRKGSS